MKKYIPVIAAVVVVLAAVLFYYGRSSRGPQSRVAVQPPATAPAPGAAAATAISGEVTETMNAGGYTYVHVNTGREEVWAAGPETPVKVGDKVSFPAGMKMENFRSDTLNRTFDAVYFVPEIRAGEGGGSPAQMPMGHPQTGAGGPETENMDFSGIEVPDGGKSVAALYAEKSVLAGKEVVVRGRVVKFTPGVMGKNWIHLRDGTGAEGTNDLTVTTDDAAKMGDIILVRGVVSLDKDLGFGYKYEIIVENAKVTVE
jgi:hypothetical protein